MTLDELRKFMEKYYRAYFTSKVTLEPTYYNLVRALDVYKIGLENNLIPRYATMKYLGYRYRRMEDFIRELNLYEPRPPQYKGIVSLCKPDKPIVYKVKKKQRRYRGRVKPERTERVILDLDIIACKPICWWGFTSWFKMFVANQLSDVLAPIGEVLADMAVKQWELALTRCDEKIEECPLYFQDGVIYTEVNIYANLHKCIIDPEHGEKCEIYPKIGKYKIFEGKLRLMDVYTQVGELE